MRVLYYLEPHHELRDPLFRFASVQNHLEREIRGLLRNGVTDVEVALLCSGSVAAAIRAHGLLAGVRLIPIAQAELGHVYSDYLEASARWYNRDFSPRALERMLDLCSAKLREFEPDVIVCYESNAPFLEELFPDALLLHDTLGIFSRAPYPETSALDPFGVGKDAFLSRYGARLRALQPNAAQRLRLETLKDAYRGVVLTHSPVQPQQVRQQFERVALLPLQVSHYFMFDENCPSELRGASQLTFVRHVLERVAPGIGVYVTMHGRQARLFTPNVLRDLRARFPNFLFSEEVQSLRWPSQHVLPHVDAVVTVSSSVGLQALIWDLPVLVLGRSHLTGVASGGSLTELPTLLNRGRTDQLDGALHYLLTHYYPLMDRYHHQGDWFVRFLERGLARKRERLDFDFYAPIDESELVMSALVHDLRPAGGTGQKRGPQARPSATDATLVAEILSADLVSFDVFDTLVTRPLSHPRAVFDLVAPRAWALLATGGVLPAQADDFRRLREEAALEAAADARARGREEYDLLSVYQLICTRLGASAAFAAELKQLEEEVERCIHIPRERGRRLFEHALRLGKRVVLVSDIFLDGVVVADILRRCGYQGYAQLYVSSEHGVLKRSGRLYDRVRELEGRPSRWVHVGDNYLVDVQTPARQGIAARHLPNISDLYARGPQVRRIWEGAALGRSLGAALQHGVISRKFHDGAQPGAPAARFGGSAYRLGYEAGGPLVLSFVQWIVEKARRDGVTHLYFLARDGYLPKQIYDLIASPELPEARYLCASRRAYGVASLRSLRDILALLETKSGPVKLLELLRDRFGLNPERLAAGTLERAGIAAGMDVVDLQEPAQRKRVERLLADNAEAILRNAAQEREDLLAYLRAQGLFDPARTIALVDIGHNGSLQVALAGLTQRADLKGYYFSTFYPAHAAYLRGHDISSYLLEFEDSTTSEHVYCQNVGLFEFLFLPAQPSFVRMQKSAGGELQAVFATADESRRFEVVGEVHRGVLEFCRDVLRATCGQPRLFQLSKNDALREMAHFAAHPDRADAALLDGVGFVDKFGGFSTRYLIATPLFPKVNALNRADYERASWWKSGARVLAGLPSGAARRRTSTQEQAERARKLRKLLRDPRRFLLDMKLTRAVRRLVDRPSGK